MKWFASIICVLMVIVSPVQGGDEVLLFSENDPKMNTAIKEARATLPVFLKLAEQHSEHWENTGLKVGLVGTGDVIEHIWVSNFTRKNPETFSGVLANEPNYLEGLHIGDKVTFTESQISDWNFVINGQAYGYYTIRVMLDRVSADQAAYLESVMHPEPLPKNWPEN